MHPLVLESLAQPKLSRLRTVGSPVPAHLRDDVGGLERWPSASPGVLSVWLRALLQRLRSGHTVRFDGPPVAPVLSPRGAAVIGCRP